MKKIILSLILLLVAIPLWHFAQEAKSNPAPATAPVQDIVWSWHVIQNIRAHLYYRNSIVDLERRINSGNTTNELLLDNTSRLFYLL
jgi:hypothetical protein